MTGADVKHKILIKSPFIRITDNNESPVISNAITGKKISANTKTIELINLFIQATSVDPELFSENSLTTINQLVKMDILVDINELEYSTYKRTMTSSRIFGAQELNSKSDEANLVFIGVPFGDGNPGSGDTRDFPNLLRKHSASYNLFNQTGQNEVNFKFMANGDKRHHIEKWIETGRVKDGGDIFISKAEPRKTAYDKMEFISDEIFSKNQIPFFIGGDHSITLPLVKGLAKTHESFSILHFDAHTDLYEFKIDLIESLHGLHNHGNFAAHCLKIPQLNKIYQFGIRDLVNASLSKSHDKVESYWIDDVKKISQNKMTLDLPENENYYITFDIDIFDPSIAPGTDTPVANGISFEEFIGLLDALQLENKNIVGIDIVETKKDNLAGNTTVELASLVILNLLDRVKLLH